METTTSTTKVTKACPTSLTATDGKQSPLTDTNVSAATKSTMHHGEQNL